MVAQILGGIVEICKLCRFVAGKTGGSKVCWLGTHDRGDLDDHLWFGIRHYNIARWQQLEN